MRGDVAAEGTGVVDTDGGVLADSGVETNTNHTHTNWNISQFLILELKSFQNLYLFLNISFPGNAFQTIFQNQFMVLKILCLNH